MYNINTKNIKKGYNSFLLLLVIGFLFLAVFGRILISNYIKLKNLDSKIISNRVNVESYESDNSTMYSPTYYYIVNGESYSCKSNTSTSNYPKTSNVIVYYNSNNPTDCMTEYSKNSNSSLILIMILPLFMIILATINIIKLSKRLLVIKNLNQNGKLVKNIPYLLEDTRFKIMNNQIQRPVVDYALSSGTTITLYGDPRFDLKDSDDGTIDLIIDENNPKNYFMDFNINRTNGNLETDYYINPLEKELSKTNNDNFKQ